ncbi:hypothetical protein JNB11_01590 [Kocuria palustris]|nr:hypothetical protein [Kocuria palustris]
MENAEKQSSSPRQVQFPFVGRTWIKTRNPKILSFRFGNIIETGENQKNEPLVTEYHVGDLPAPELIPHHRQNYPTQLTTPPYDSIKAQQCVNQLEPFVAYNVSAETDVSRVQNDKNNGSSAQTCILET